MEQKLIYAVDDEENIRELYACALKNAGYDCHCFENGEALFSALKDKTPALILLDVMLDGADGFAILERLKGGAFRTIPVIMVSAKGEEMSKVKGLNLGADDYIAKPFGVLELLARVNANLRKVSRAACSYGGLVVDEGKHEISVSGVPLTLTRKEYELLKLLIAYAPDLVEREEILRRVWGEDYLGETRTLDIHIASLRKAISGGEAKISTVRGVGYRLI